MPGRWPSGSRPTAPLYRRSCAPPRSTGRREAARAEEEAKRRELADELAREAQARAEESRRSAEAAEAKAKAERQARRLTGALAAAVLGLVVSVGGGFAWFQRNRAERQARVDLALREAEVLRGTARQAGDDPARWAKAVDAARSVERLLADVRDEPTRRRVAALVESVTTEARTADKNHELLDKLIDIRSAKADDRDGSAIDAAYAAAFRDAEIDVAALPPAEAGAMIKARPIAVAVALAAGLDDWAAVRRDHRRNRAGAQQLTQAARAADLDPWRNQLRDALDLPEKQQRLDALRAAARSANVEELPPVSLDLLGSALRDAGDPQMAESVLRQAQRRHPGDVRLNYNLAQCLEKLARRDEAIRYFTAARSIRPEIAHELAHALRNKGESDEAIAVFQDLTRLCPGNGRHFLCLSVTLEKRGHSRQAGVALDAAVAALREVIHQRSDDDTAHCTLGIALKLQGKPNEAIVEYREAVRLRPDIAINHRNLADSLQEQGKLDEAIAEHREAIRLEPDDPDVHAGLAGSLDTKGKLEEAIAEYRIAIRLQPDIHESHEHLGRVFVRQGKLEEAIAEYRTALRIDPTCANVRRFLGDALRDQGKLNAAIAEYKEAMRLKPDDANVLYNLCAVLKLLRRDEQVIAVYSDAIGLKPDSAVGHNGLAWELALAPTRPRREYDEAIAHARKAVELAPKDGNSVNTLALAEYRLGHWAESIAASERSMALQNGGDAGDWFFLAMAHSQDGRKDEARKWFDKAVAWTREKDPKNAELRQFWTEAAELLAQPGPDRPGPVAPAASAKAKPR